MPFDFEMQISDKSDKELLQIYKKADEYQDNFIVAIETELEKRNLDFLKAKQQRDKRAEVLDELAQKPERGNTFYIVLGFVSALLGGLLGIIAGYVYSRSKRTSITGNRFFAYDQQTRDLGTVMMGLGVIVMALSILSRFPFFPK
ncbi:MAG: hypothetical protein JWP69_1787 [Flaviaesturariibacter sp.]|nr:hypothetical protein [Flaviaesturariibacter sp.]